MRGLFTLALLGCSLTSCGVGSFACADSSECVNGGIAGSCEASGFCSFPDPECSSGRRYGALAPPHLAELCVDDVQATDTDATTVAPTNASTSAPSTSATAEATGDPTLDTSSEGPTGLPVCGNGTTEPGEMCDDGNADNNDDCNDACQVPGTEIFFETWNGDVDDRCYDLALAGDDGFVVTGISGEVQGNGRLFVLKYDGDGQQEWTYVARERSGGWGIARAATGQVVAGGFTQPAAIEIPWAVVLSPEGVFDRAATVGTVGRITMVAAGATDGIYFSGWQRTELGIVDGWVARFELPLDAPEWEVVFIGDAGGDDEFFGVVLDEGAKTVYALGDTQPVADEPKHALVAAYAADDGTQLWLQTQASAGDAFARFWSGTVTATGELVVAGATGSTNDADLWFGRVAGDKVSLTVDPRPSDDEGHAAVRDAVGYVYVTGYRRAESGDQNDAFIRKYTPDGKAIVWEHELNETGALGDKAYGLRLASNGNVLACGYSSQSDSATNVWVGRYAH